MSDDVLIEHRRNITLHVRSTITLRYFADMTQAQIAAEVGVSQMQISRLLARSLTRPHEGMLASAAVQSRTGGPVAPGRRSRGG